MRRHPENRCCTGRTAQGDSRFPRTIFVPGAEINRRSTRTTAKTSGERRQPVCAVSGKVSSRSCWISASRCVCVGQHVTSVWKRRAARVTTVNFHQRRSSSFHPRSQSASHIVCVPTCVHLCPPAVGNMQNIKNLF